MAIGREGTELHHSQLCTLTLTSWTARNTLAPCRSPKTAQLEAAMPTGPLCAAVPQLPRPLWELSHAPDLHGQPKVLEAKTPSPHHQKHVLPRAPIHYSGHLTLPVGSERLKDST